jgi:hypothetical protein
MLPIIWTKETLFFKQVDRFINEFNIDQIILAGDSADRDYNDLLSKIKTKEIYQSKIFDKPVHNLKSIIKSHKLIDIWRQKNKTNGNVNNMSCIQNANHNNL